MSETAAAIRFDESDAHALLRMPLPRLLQRARALADGHWGSTITFSPKVFLPLVALGLLTLGATIFQRLRARSGKTL